MTEYKTTPHRNAYGSRLIVQMPYGSHRWFTVKDDGREIAPINASWVPLPLGVIATQRANGIVGDGCARFFRTRRELLAALNGDGH